MQAASATSSSSTAAIMNENDDDDSNPPLMATYKHLLAESRLDADDRTTTMELGCFAPLAPCSMAEGYASSARYHRLKQNSANIQLIMTSDPYSCFSFFFRDSKLKMYSIFLFFCVFVSPIIFFSNFFINFFFLILILLFYYLFSLSLLFILKLINNQMFCDIDICSFCR